MPSKCSVENCATMVYALTMCRRHYAQVKRTGQILPDRKVKYVLEGDIYKMYFANSTIVGIVDTTVYAEVVKYNWSISPTGYIHNNKVGFLHRFLLGVTDTKTKVVDHINRNPWDNRLINLREVLYFKNSWNRKVSKHNTTGLKGVFWNKATSKWLVKIGYHNKRLYFGQFTCKLRAMWVYNEASKELFGELASINTIHQIINESENPTCPN